MELRNKSVKRENVRKEEKPKPAHSKKAPLISTLVVSTALAVGACTAKIEKEPENRERELVAEKPETKTAEVFMSEVEVPAEKLQAKPLSMTTVKVGDKFDMFEREMPVLTVTKIDEKGIEFTSDSAFEKDAEHIFEIHYDKPYAGSTNENTYKSVSVKKGENLGEAVIFVTEISLAEKPETIEVFMSEVEVPEDKFETKTVTKTVKEGDLVYVDEAGPASVSLKAIKVGEKEVELAFEVESLFEMEGHFKHPVVVPFGESRKTGEGVLTWEVKAEKGKNEGEAVVTVKYPDISE